MLSLAASHGDLEDVAIQVEAVTADLVVSSGGADTVWQAEAFCHDIVRRRAQHGLATTHVHHPEAGHRAVLPGESPPALRLDMPRSGGTAEANQAHGEQVLSAILERIALATGAT